MSINTDPARATTLGARPGEVPPAIGAFDAMILSYLMDHLEGEAEILGEYRQLAESPDAPVRYLAQLILEDEERHHRVLTELANKFRTNAGLVEDVPHVPWLTKSRDRQGLGRAVRRLRGFERRDLRQLRKLARRLRPTRGHSLDAVIVATLEMDTRKHLRLLDELQRIANR